MKQQPSFGGFDRHGASADFGGFPRFFAFHDMPMAAPVDKVLALAEENLTEWRVAIIARPAEHHVTAIDAARKQNAVSIERQERILEHVKGFEIMGEANADAWAVKAVAPSDPVTIF